MEGSPLLGGKFLIFFFVVVVLLLLLLLFFFFLLVVVIGIDLHLLSIVWCWHLILRCFLGRDLIRSTC